MWEPLSALFRCWCFTALCSPPSAYVLWSSKTRYGFRWACERKPLGRVQTMRYFIINFSNILIAAKIVSLLFAEMYLYPYCEFNIFSLVGSSEFNTAVVAKDKIFMRLLSNHPIIDFNFTTSNIEFFLHGFIKTHSVWEFLNVGLCVGDRIGFFSYQRAQVNHVFIF